MKPIIAIVDDSPMMRNFLGVYLQKKYEVLPFDNAKDAIFRLLKVKQIDLILLDLNMPDMDGFEFLDIVKSTDRLKDVPIIILSGVSKSEDRIRSLEKGAVDFVSKPFNPKELEIRICNFFKMREQPKEFFF